MHSEGRLRAHGPSRSNLNLIAELIEHEQHVIAVTTGPKLLIACIREGEGHKQLEIILGKSSALAVREDPEALDPSRRLSSSAFIVWVNRTILRARRDEVGENDLVGHVDTGLLQNSWRRTRAHRTSIYTSS